MRILSLSAVGLLCAALLDVFGNVAAQSVSLPPSDGRPTVLFFIRTDCPISNRYAPVIQQLSDKYRRVADFYLLYPSQLDQPAQVEAHMREYGYEAHHLRWLRDGSPTLQRDAQVTITPEAALFDENHKLVYHGRIDDLYVSVARARIAATRHDLEAALIEVLAHKPVTNSSAPAVGCYLSDVQ